MKICITKTCECVFVSELDEPQDCRLNEGTVLEGKLYPADNWIGEPLPAINLIGENGIWCGIPNDSYSCTN